MLNPLALDLQGSTLIEASAGTGKTFTIAFLYVRLVLGHGQPEDSPLKNGIFTPNLLVVTFTDAATQELRERIRARLTQAADVFDARLNLKRNAENKLLLDLRDKGYPDQSLWPECRKKLLLAAEWMDEAAVSTIHGWCYRMLIEHAFDSGSLFKLTLETDQKELILDCVRDYWRTFIYGLPVESMDDVLGQWATPEMLYREIKSLLSCADELTTNSDSVAEIIQQSGLKCEQEVTRLKQQDWLAWQPQVEALLTELHAQKRLHGLSKNTMLGVWGRLIDWAQSNELLPDLSSKGFTNQTPKGLKDILKGDGPIPEHPAFDTIQALIDFSQNLPNPKAELLQHAAVWVGRRFEAEKHKRAEMGFDDLLKRMDQALHSDTGEQLAATLRRQFPVALIDEFQDTDPLQYRIFQRIYRIKDHDPSTCLLMIGDPKQAIYGFRGADIYTYLQARQQVQQRIYSLGTNFRSDENMVKAVNQLFEAADQHEDGAFLFGSGKESSLPFCSVQANGTARRWQVNGNYPPHLTFWLMDSQKANDKGKIKAITKESAQSQLALTCAAEIARLLSLGRQGQAGFAVVDDSQPFESVKPADIAVLVLTHKEAAIMRQALTQCGIKSVYLSERDSVLSSPEAQDILYWLQAFAEPRHLLKVRTALATPTLQLGWDSLNALLTDENKLEQQIEHFIAYQLLWQKQGVLAVIHRFLMDFSIPSRLLAQPGGERQLTNILHIAELLQQDSQVLDGEHALLHHYIQLLRTAQEEDEYRSLRLESDAGLVKVVTVFKSKGLEYPLVFLPFATSITQPKGKAAFLNYHDDQWQLQRSFAPTAEQVQQADTEQLGEQIRKFYVAATRARYAMWIGVAETEKWQNSGLGYVLAGYDESVRPAECLDNLVGDQDPVMQVLPLVTESYRYTEDIPESLGPALMVVHPIKDDWWIASYSSIKYQVPEYRVPVLGPEAEDSVGHNLQEEQTMESEGLNVIDAPLMSLHQFPKGAVPGTFLHDALEWICGQGFKQIADQPELLRDYLQPKCQNQGWENWLEVLHAWLLQLITQALPVGEAGDELVLADLTEVRAEMEFWVEICQVSTAILDQRVRETLFPAMERPQVLDQQFNGMLKGFIDLVFVHQGQYYILDYKSNALGEGDSDYTAQNMRETILANRYDLQYVLYLLALHRLLKVRLSDYDYDRHVGGAVYLFLRGIHAPSTGVFCDKPPRTLIETLDTLLTNGTDGMGGGL